MAALFAAVSVPSATGSCTPSVSHCLANDTSSSHCLASIYNIYSVCLAEASGTAAEAQLERELAAALARAAAAERRCDRLAAALRDARDAAAGALEE